MRLNLSAQILLGLVLGIAVGLFFGEIVADLKLFGDIFVALLQMTVLPYIMVSLVGGLGRMDPALGRRLAWRGLLVLLLVPEAAVYRV